jgi:hypothetical protein
MKAIVLAFGMLLSGCVSVEEVGTDPINGRIVDRDGVGVANAMIWVTYAQGTPRVRAYGPYFTDSTGRFTVAPHPHRMLDTGTIFDGARTPMLMVIHPRRGVFGSIPSMWRSTTLTWPDMQNVAYTFRDINGLPKENQPTARDFVAKGQ